MPAPACTRRARPWRSGVVVPAPRWSRCTTCTSASCSPVEAPLGTVVAVVGTAAAFAADHGLVEGFPALFLFGIGVALVRVRTDSIYPGMLLHACFNAFALATAVAR